MKVKSNLKAGLTVTIGNVSVTQSVTVTQSATINISGGTNTETTTA